MLTYEYSEGVIISMIKAKFSAYLVIPLLVAIISIGARSLSSARFRNEKHSMSNMCTSSINST